MHRRHFAPEMGTSDGPAFRVWEQGKRRQLYPPMRSRHYVMGSDWPSISGISAIRCCKIPPSSPHPNPVVKQGRGGKRKADYGQTHTSISTAEVLIIHSAGPWHVEASLKLQSSLLFRIWNKCSPIVQQAEAWDVHRATNLTFANE